MNINGNIQNKKDELAKKCYNMIKTMYTNDYSEFLDIFYGIHVSNIYSVDGEILTQTPEPYFLISLPIPQNNKNPTLEDCFDLYTKEELLTDENQFIYKDSKIDALREIKFWKFPDILVIDLKRFNNNAKKNKILITFPLENFNVSQYCIGYNKDLYVYDLYGICNHSGGVMGGHYTSYIKNANGKWYHFNDTQVTEIDNLDSLISNKAYCFFYRKKIIK
jgi:ubiquitin C-terminal hydrolase